MKSNDYIKYKFILLIFWVNIIVKYRIIVKFCKDYVFLILFEKFIFDFSEIK